MTRQEQLEHYKNAIFNAEHYGREVMVMENDPDFAARSARHAAHAAGVALDHLAALEQQAIDAYLADVPLPDGWTEEDCAVCFRYWEVVEGIDDPIERVYASDCIVRVNSMPRDCPAIPLPVLLRAAVQCHTLRAALHGGEAREGQ